jgi:hypothetical protein
MESPDKIYYQAVSARRAPPIFPGAGTVPFSGQRPGRRLKLPGLTAARRVGLNRGSHHEARSDVAISLGGLVMAAGGPIGQNPRSHHEAEAMWLSLSEAS